MRINDVQQPWDGAICDDVGEYSGETADDVTVTVTVDIEFICNRWWSNSNRNGNAEQCGAMRL